MRRRRRPGGVGINSATGSFTYTPTASARHTAALISATPAQRSDLFTVTVTDGRRECGRCGDGGHRRGQCGAGRGAVTVGVPDSGTGVVAGRAGHRRRRDSLTFSAPATTVRGSVGINATAGSFTYTPTVAARRIPPPRVPRTPTRWTRSPSRWPTDTGGTASIPGHGAGQSPGGPGRRSPAFPGRRGSGHLRPAGATAASSTSPTSTRTGPDPAVGRRPARRQVRPLPGQRSHRQPDPSDQWQCHHRRTNLPGRHHRGASVTDETPYQDQAITTAGGLRRKLILQHIRIRPGRTGRR